MSTLVESYRNALVPVKTGWQMVREGLRLMGMGIPTFLRQLKLEY